MSERYGADILLWSEHQAVRIERLANIDRPYGLAELLRDASYHTTRERAASAKEQTL